MNTQTPSKSSLQNKWDKVFASEFEIDERFRVVATTFIIIFSIGYSVSFLGLMQYVAYLGPGLGDDLNFSPYLEVFNHFYRSANGDWWNLPLLLFVGLSIANLIFTAAIIFVGYWIYPITMGKPFPLTVLFTYMSLNAICTIGIVSIHVLTGVAAYALGYDFMAGLKAFRELLDTLIVWANQVPTLVDLPVWLAFFALQMIGGFFHYWFHRLAHESRILWLLFHRTHHMTPELIQPSTQAVFNAFPFFLFAAVPYVVIFTVVGKLITADSLLIYLIIYKLLSAFSNLFSHQSALYSWAQTKWYIRVINTITSEGVYHYLHHSSEKMHNSPRGNLVNIGGGLFFFWDRVFGTYLTATEHKPLVGLQGMKAEEMTSNPLRLAFAGIAQLLYELRYNFNARDIFLIIFGPSDYVPKNSYEYVLRKDS